MDTGCATLQPVSSSHQEYFLLHQPARNEALIKDSIATVQLERIIILTFFSAFSTLAEQTRSLAGNVSCKKSG